MKSPSFIFKAYVKKDNVAARVPYNKIQSNSKQQ